MFRITTFVGNIIVIIKRQSLTCTTPIYSKVRPPLINAPYNYLLVLGTEKWSECAFPKSTINHFLASSDNCEKRSMDFFICLQLIMRGKGEMCETLGFLTLHSVFVSLICGHIIFLVILHQFRHLPFINGCYNLRGHSTTTWTEFCHL